jgi:hypothetical protein
MLVRNVRSSRSYRQPRRRGQAPRSRSGRISGQARELKLSGPRHRAPAELTPAVRRHGERRRPRKRIRSSTTRVLLLASMPRPRGWRGRYRCLRDSLSLPRRNRVWRRGSMSVLTTHARRGRVKVQAGARRPGSHFASTRPDGRASTSCAVASHARVPARRSLENLA